MFTIHAYPLTGWCPYCQKPTAQEYLGTRDLPNHEYDYAYRCGRCKKEIFEKP